MVSSTAQLPARSAALASTVRVVSLPTLPDHNVRHDEAMADSLSRQLLPTTSAARVSLV